MKKKFQFYSNFKHRFNEKLDSFKDLVVDDLFNINLDNDFIESEYSNVNLFDYFYNETESNTIKLNNKDIIEKSLIITPYEFFDEIENIKTTRLFLLDISNQLFELNKDTALFEFKHSFSTKPRLIFSKNCLYYFDSNNTALVIENKNLPSVENIPHINSFTNDKTYLYFTVEDIPNKVFITELCELKNLSNHLEQYTTLSTTVEDGAVYKVLNLKNKIYIFTQYSILKLEENQLLKQNNFDLLIYKNSIKQIDDYIIFYSSDGLYLFDTIDINQVFDNCLNIDKNADFLYFNHKLYILSSNFENVVFKINLNNTSISKLKFQNLSSFYKIKNYSSYCLSIKNNNQLEILNTPTISTEQNYPEQKIIFKPTFFNSNSLKQINNVFINSDGEFQLKVISDIANTTLNFSNSTKFISTAINGNYFIFEIFSKSKFSIKSILVNFVEIGD